LTIPETESYEGRWEEDEKEGWGLLGFEDGRIYEGEWHLGLMHGIGKWTHPTGKIEYGEWYLHKQRTTCSSKPWDDAKSKINEFVYFRNKELNTPAAAACGVILWLTSSCLRLASAGVGVSFSFLVSIGPRYVQSEFAN
jgi:hypothetical protein